MRQISNYVGNTAGNYTTDFETDSLGNLYSLNITAFSLAGPWDEDRLIECYYAPSGGTPNPGGALTYRGVSFDRPVLPNALIVILVFYRFPAVVRTMTRQVMIEFGPVADGVDPGTSIEDSDFFETIDATSHIHAEGTLPSALVGPQVWIAANVSEIATTPSTPVEFTAFAFNGATERAYYREASTPLADHTAAFTTPAVTKTAGFLTHFIGVEAFDPAVSDPPTCCDHTGPGGSPPGTGYGPPADNPPVNTPRVIPPGGEPPEYNACTGGGDPATASDPTDAQSLTSAASPVFWLQMTLPDTTVLRFNSQGLNFTSGNGSVSTPRVLTWGDITHALADEQGSIEAFRTSVTLSDADRAIRTHLSHATNRHIDSREAIIFVETRANAALGTAPRIAARGVITNWKSDTDLTVTIEIADPLGFRYSAISLDRPYPFRRVSANFFPGCPEQNLGRAVPDIYGDYSDDFLWSVDPRRIPIGICPVIDIGPAADINGLGATDMTRAGLIAGHAIPGIQSFFGSNNHADGPGSVRLSLASAEFRWPGLSGWPAYHDITGLDGTVERFAIMTGIGPRMDAHVNGQVPITCNPCGTEDVGDGSGDVVTNAVSQVQHFIQHKVLGNYRTGNYGAVPTFPSSSTPKVRTSSFDAARTIINARVGGGYVHAFYIGDQKATREHLADICVGSDLRPGINHHGQVLVVTLDDGADTSGLVTFTATDHIEESTFDVDPRIDAIVNVVEVTCGREAATGRHPWPATTLRNEASVTQHGERIGQPLAMNTTLIHAYAMDIAARKLMRMSQPLALVRFRVDLRGLALSLGQLIRVTHFAGIGSTGWTERVLMVTKISTDPNESDFLCTIEAEDINDIVGALQMVIDTGTIDTGVLA